MTIWHWLVILMLAAIPLLILYWVIYTAIRAALRDARREAGEGSPEKPAP